MPNRSKILRSIFALASIASALVAPNSHAGASGAQDRFTTTVEVLQFQIEVKDDQGEPVSGLTSAELELSINGRDRHIVALYEVDLRRPGGDRPLLAEAQGESPVPPAGWRQFLLFFDASFNSPRGVRAAQLAAFAFVDDQVHPSDLLAVATHSLNEGVRLLVPFTTNREQVRDAIEGLGLNQATMIVDRAGLQAEYITGGELQGSGPTTGRSVLQDPLSGFVGAVYRSEVRAYQAHVVSYLAQLEELAQILRVVRGRKHVVLFSEGFQDSALIGAGLDALAQDSQRVQEGRMADVSQEERFGSVVVRSTLDDATAKLREVDAVLHMIDPSGVGGGRDAGLSGGGGSPSGSLAKRGAGRSSLTALATATNGTIVWNTNDLAGALADLENKTNRFYVLAFAREAGDGDVLNVEVRSTKPGVTVTSAPSKFATPPAYEDMSEVQRQAQLAEYITKHITGSGLSFESYTVPFPGRRQVSRLGVVIEVPWRQLEALARQAKDDTITLEILAYVINEQGTIIDLSNRQVTLSWESMRASRAEGLPFRFYDLLWSGPGSFQVVTLVREAKLGQISTRTQRLSVPSYGEGSLSVSGPVLVDGAHPGLILLGMTPETIPPYKKGGPVEYPFSVADVDLTPSIDNTVTSGTKIQLFVSINGLSVHPFTGRPQLSLVFALESANGERTIVDEVRVLRQGRSSDGAEFGFLVEITLPAAAQGGVGWLEATAADVLGETKAAGQLELWVTESSGDRRQLP